MIISPPFLRDPKPRRSGSDHTVSRSDATADLPKPDPTMDIVDEFDLKHGIYPIAFDRRHRCVLACWPMPSQQNAELE